MPQSSAPLRAPIPIVSSIAPLAANADAWLTDIWGVMHNGITPFEGAAEACARFRDTGGIVLLLSNAPRPADSVAAQLDRIGVPRSAWDVILSSGDASRRLMADLGDKPIFHVGPERDVPLFDGLDVTVAREAEAEAVVCTGLFDDTTETPSDYEAMLTRLAAGKLPMICANPDITVERGGKIIYCAGAIAALYETLGGDVTYAGKPYLPIYEMAFATLSKLKRRNIERARVLAIGDGVKTDIAGAAAAGVASVFVASGVHVARGSHLDSRALDTLFPDETGRPVAAMTGLVW